MTVSKRTRNTLRQLRNERGLRLEQVAASLELSERTVRRHEDGTTPLRRLHREAYANFYGVDPADIEAAA